MDDSTKNTIIAVGVGVGTVGAIATTMYFLGGREAPKMPSLGELGAFGKREIGFGSLTTSTFHSEVARLARGGPNSRPGVLQSADDEQVTYLFDHRTDAVVFARAARQANLNAVCDATNWRETGLLGGDGFVLVTVSRDPC